MALTSRAVPRLADACNIGGDRASVPASRPEYRAPTAPAVIRSARPRTPPPLTAAFRRHRRGSCREGNILIVNLARGQVGEDTASLLGALLVTAVTLAAFSRAEVRPGAGSPSRPPSGRKALRAVVVYSA